jgi:hypothetical protein
LPANAHGHSRLGRTDETRPEQADAGPARTVKRARLYSFRAWGDSGLRFDKLPACRTSNWHQF